jgi:alanine racemase
MSVHLDNQDNEWSTPSMVSAKDFLQHQSMGALRPTVAEIDLSALRYNFQKVSQHLGNSSKILSVVKADAYGHGALEIARELEKCGTDFLGVALCEEAVELRDAGIVTPIMVMGGIFDGQVEKIITHDLIPVIFDLDTALQLNEISALRSLNIKIHVKVDTGMGRVGIMPWEVEGFFQKLKECKNLKVDGLVTHLSVVDECGDYQDNFTSRQVQTFQGQIRKVMAMGFAPTYFHLANSAAIIKKLDPLFNLVRPGLMLYGVNPCPSIPFDLHPVMSLKTKIIVLKKLPRGYPVSYGNTFVTERDTIIATLPIGYADGYSRLLSNKAKVIVRGHKAPVVGIVCMDMIMIDVTDVPDVKLNDEVTLLGSHGKEFLTASELSEISQTIPYEFLSNISKRVPRIYLHKSCP